MSSASGGVKANEAEEQLLPLSMRIPSAPFAAESKDNQIARHVYDEFNWDEPARVSSRRLPGSLPIKGNAGVRQSRRRGMVAALGSEEEVQAQILTSDREDLFERKDGSYRMVRRSARHGSAVATANLAATYANNIKPPPANPRRRRRQAPPQNKSPEAETGVAQERQVEAIIDHRTTENATEFRVKWSGMDEDQNTWEPESNIKGSAKITEYYASKNEPAEPKE